MQIYKIADKRLLISEELRKLFIEDLQPWSYDDAVRANKVESLETAAPEVIRFYNIHHSVYLKLTHGQFDFTPEEKKVIWETASNIGIDKALSKPLLNEITRLGILFGFYKPVQEGEQHNIVYRGKKYKTAMALDPDAYANEENPSRLGKDHPVQWSPYGMVQNKVNPEIIHQNYQGVHFTDEEEIAAVYACVKATKDDPPVLIEVYSTGMDKQLDIDAIVNRDLDEFIDNKRLEWQTIINSDIDDEEKSSKITEDLENIMMDNDSGDNINDANDFVANKTKGVAPWVIANILKDKNDQQIVAYINDLISRNIPKELLIAMVNQFRIMTPVGSSVVKGIYQIPLVDFDIDPHEVDENMSDEDLEEKGWHKDGDDIKTEEDKLVVGFESLENGWWLKKTPLYVNNQMRLPLNEEESTTWHGTSLSRAKQAYPELLANVNVPEPQEEEMVEAKSNNWYKTAVISPEKARSLKMKTELPQDEAFRKAVENTKGARITEDGLEIELTRNQHPDQTDRPSARSGVFYQPEGSFNKYPYSGKQGYGGSENIKGTTLLKRPIFVKGATGGKAPERAYDMINGKGSFDKMRTKVLNKAIGNFSKSDPYATYHLLEEFGGDVGLAQEIERIRNVTPGNVYVYTIQENIIANSVRKAGYDSVVGYSQRRDGTFFISEVFDVREATYPSKFNPGGTVHQTFLQKEEVKEMKSKSTEAKNDSWYKTAKQTDHSYSWVFLDLPSEVSQQIIEFGESIDPEDLYKSEADGGLEKECHVTVKYALTTDEAKEIKERLDGEKGGKFHMGESSIFETEEYDVVKIEVESEDLERLHNRLNELPHEDKYPDYKAHATIAYVKKGKGKKYVGKFKINKDFKFKEVHFGDRKEKNTKINLSKSTYWYKAAKNTDKNRPEGDADEEGRRGQRLPEHYWVDIDGDMVEVIEGKETE